MKWWKTWPALTLLLFLLAAAIGPILRPYQVSDFDLQRRFEAPSLNHPLGLDDSGSDILAQTLLGTRLSLSVGISVLLISLLVGGALGSLAAWKQGYWDSLLMRTIDALHAFPGFLLSLGFAAFLGPSTLNVIFALSITGWTSIARLARTEILRIKQQEFVLAAEALGADALRQIFHHVWPQFLGPLSVQLSANMSGILIADASLSFLGLGPSPLTPTWGLLLNAGRRYLFEAPHMVLAPGLCLVLLILSFNRMADHLRARFAFLYQT